MRILIAHHSLANRTGRGMEVLGLAAELRRRGHNPVAYSTLLGEIAGELRSATVPVIDRLGSLTEPPDLIHGQHHYETLTALLHFPGTPAIYHCHGGLPWEEAAVKHPNILLYLAADEWRRERMIAEEGIPGNRIEVLLNSFDQRRFPPRPPLPAKPKLALVFNSEFNEHNGLPLLAEACRRRDIELHTGDSGSRDATVQPGAELAGYDIVFAEARCAIEALGVGTAVILCAPGRLGPMVTSESFQRLRQWNFGIGTLTQALDGDGLEAELRKYDPDDAVKVAQLTRAHCELQPAVDRIVDLYQRVLSENFRPADAGQTGAASARCLERWSGKYQAHLAVTQERDNWIDRANAAERTLALRKNQQGEMELLRQDRQKWIDRCLAAEQAVAAVSGQRDGAEQRNLHAEKVVSRRDSELARISQELTSLRGSATWRWGQRLVTNWPVQLLFGGVVRAVARSNRPENSLPVAPPSPLPQASPALDDPAATLPTLQARAARMMAEQGFLGVPLETFSQAGREQLIALLAAGLSPESRVFEFGCGCLRIGCWLVRFLEAGYYHGIEPSRHRVETGLRYLFTSEEVERQRPRFDYNAVFNSSVFNSKFDFFLARSIWTHASKPQIEATLDSFLRDAAPGATFLASYFPAQTPDEDYMGSQWVGTSHECEIPGVIRHALPWILQQCERRGLICDELEGHDCDDQLWLRIRQR